jgi:mRNA interferase MazF
MVIQRGEIWWAMLAEPRGSEPGKRRPVVVVQSDAFNRSAINTVLVAVVSSNIHLATAPGNVQLSRRASGLQKVSVVNVSQLITVDRRFMQSKVRQLSADIMRDVDAGLKLVMALR